MVEITQQQFESLLDETRQYLMLKTAVLYAEAKNLTDEMSLANPNEPNLLYRLLFTVRFVQELLQGENDTVSALFADYGVEAEAGKRCLDEALEEAIGGLDITLMTLEELLNEVNDNWQGCLLETFARHDVVRVVDEIRFHP